MLYSDLFNLTHLDCGVNCEVDDIFWHLKHRPPSGTLRRFSPKLFAINLILVCGDVALNPGPAKYPCTVCTLAVRSNQRALLCDNCNLWIHCTCCGVGKAQYCSYQQQEDFSWMCPSCLTAHMPFHDCSVLSFTDNFDCSNSSFHEDFYVSIDSPTSTHSFLRLAHLNCRSLLCKLDEVLSFCNVNAVDITV